ncbi:Uu.00g141050.m01.CDS01 [Anthostomella pinea]|uniref:Uu.00g141050.m01.CDS01 n=1 Tax=Anthostomella pinea TaxID=933095 RepID=A0AAI8YLG8_9PEZI|nr:Uu.00g141050.m01.CDS01 [Anthostomella pinea]
MAYTDLSAPAMPPPPGETSNFTNPPNGNATGLGALLLMLIISTIFICIRMYANAFITKKFWVEDVLVLLGYLTFVLTVWTAFMFVQYPGFFVHTWNVTVGDEIAALYYVFLFGVFYSIALAFVKMSIPLEWCRIFVPPGTWSTSYFWWGAMAVVALQAMFLPVIVVLLNVQCLPHAAIWDIRLLPDATCIPLPTLQKLSASVHLVTDVAILVLPQKIIFDLQLSLRKKAGLAVVFGLGALGVVCSVFRLIDTIMLANEPDVFFYTGPVELWCTAEVTCGLFVACAPTLPRVIKDTPLLRRVFRASTRRGATSSDGPTAIRTTGGKRGGGTDTLGTKLDYTKMDEENEFHMINITKSDSTEVLREAAKPGITRTTDITVHHSASPDHNDPRPWSHV